MTLLNGFKERQLFTIPQRYTSCHVSKIIKQEYMNISLPRFIGACITHLHVLYKLIQIHLPGVNLGCSFVHTWNYTLKWWSTSNKMYSIAGSKERMLSNSPLETMWNLAKPVRTSYILVVSYQDLNCIYPCGIIPGFGPQTP